MEEGIKFQVTLFCQGIENLLKLCEALKNSKVEHNIQITFGTDQDGFEFVSKGMDAAINLSNLAKLQTQIDEAKRNIEILEKQVDDLRKARKEEESLLKKQTLPSTM
jgi:predicted  nucleic acid-binding Zn-ribbon protein